MHRIAATALTLAALVASPAAARADELIATVARPTPVSALDGRVVWSDYDALANRYYLTQRVAGITSRLPVEPRAVPFDVDLGPDTAGRTVAAYSRCRREPPRRDPRTGNALAQLPEWRRGQGCDLYLYSFEAGREARVRHASIAAASEFLPTVWTDRIAFARVYERRRGNAGRRAYLYVRPNSLFRSQGRRGDTRRMPAGPRARDLYCTARPRRCRRLAEPGPTALDLATRRLVFGWDSTGGGPTSSVYLDVLRSTGRTAQRRLDRAGSGEIQARELIAPQFDDQVRVVWLDSLYGDTTRAAVRRWSFMDEGREQAPLTAFGTDPILRTVIAGAGDGTGYLYLASGLVPPGEPCATPASCIAEPGCTPAQPCLLLRAAAPAFRRNG
jgi:hypothetical protein